jgi:hypothetical protein
LTWAGHPAGVRRGDSSFLRGADALVHCVCEIPVGGRKSNGINPHGGIHDIGGFASGLLIPGFGAEGHAAGLLVKAANGSLTRIVEEGAATVAAGPPQRPQGPQGPRPLRSRSASSTAENPSTRHTPARSSATQPSALTRPPRGPPISPPSPQRCPVHRRGLPRRHALLVRRHEGPGTDRKPGGGRRARERSSCQRVAPGLGAPDPRRVALAPCRGRDPMMLVPEELHSAVRDTGGAAVITGGSGR